MSPPSRFLSAARRFPDFAHLFGSQSQHVQHTLRTQLVGWTTCTKHLQSRSDQNKIPLVQKHSFSSLVSSSSRNPASLLSAPFRITAIFQLHRSQSTHIPIHSSSPFENTNNIAADDPVSSSSSARKGFPQTSSKGVAYWLLASAVSVFGIVIFGGLTRLTESGLSITEWRPVTGSLPPFNADDWESEFAKYRASPEYIKLNPTMDVHEFKKIYWMEWTHRLWGRVIGMTFLIPTIYFIARKRVAPHMAWKLVGICGLIGVQGFIGWWMVKSGLKDDLFAPGEHPRVSQYRLAAHLGTAFVAYSGMLLAGLSILREHALLKNPQEALSLIEKLSLPHMRRFSLAVTLLTGLVFTTVMSGALVAGLDAGLIYNEFPWMGMGLAPPKEELLVPRYSRLPDQSDLWWRNALENPTLVQLDHRILAMTTFSTIVGLFLTPRFSSKLKTTIPKDVHKGLTGVMHMASVQVVLGISTLIYMVPMWLAAMHQGGALALLTTVLVLGSRMRISRRTIRLVQEAAAKRRTTQHAASSPATLKQTGGSVEQVVR